MKKLSLLFFSVLFVFYLSIPAFAADSDPIYKFDYPVTFEDGSWLDTNVQLFDFPKDFTICIKFTPFSTTSATVLSCDRLSIRDSGGFYINVDYNTAVLRLGYGTALLYSAVIIRSVVSSDLLVYFIDPHDTVVSSGTIPFSFFSTSDTVRLGNFSGSISSFSIYDYAFNQQQAVNFLNDMDIDTPASTNEFSFLYVLLSALCFLFAIFVFVR